MIIRIQLFSLLLLILIGCQAEVEKPEHIRPVRAIQVADSGSFGKRIFPGKTRAEERVNLSFRVEGPLINRPIDVGDRVKKGDLLAQIDPRDYEVRLRNTKGRLNRSKANLTFAESDYNRAIRIQKDDPGAISERLVEKKREDRNRLRAEVNSLEAEVDAAKDSLSYTHLEAPFEGIVVTTFVENFEFVQAKQPIVRILNSSRIEMLIDIPENLISYIPYAKEFTVSLDPFPDTKVIATVKEIGTEASFTTRTYPVTLIMDQPEDVRILSGMSGEARLTKAEIPTEIDFGMEVPLTALFSPENDQNSYVWVIDEETMTVSRRLVETGSISETGIVIIKGLQPDEWIVTGGVNYLREGQKVTFTLREIGKIE